MITKKDIDVLLIDLFFGRSDHFDYYIEQFLKDNKLFNAINFKILKEYCMIYDNQPLVNSEEIILIKKLYRSFKLKYIFNKK